MRRFFFFLNVYAVLKKGNLLLSRLKWLEVYIFIIFKIPTWPGLGLGMSGTGFQYDDGLGWYMNCPEKTCSILDSVYAQIAEADIPELGKKDKQH